MVAMVVRVVCLFPTAVFVVLDTMVDVIRAVCAR